MASGTARVSVHAWCLVQYGVYVLVMCAPVSCCRSGHECLFVLVSPTMYRREREREQPRCLGAPGGRQVSK